MSVGHMSLYAHDLRGTFNHIGAMFLPDLGQSLALVFCSALSFYCCSNPEPSNQTNVTRLDPDYIKKLSEITEQFELKGNFTETINTTERKLNARIQQFESNVMAWQKKSDEQFDGAKREVKQTVGDVRENLATVQEKVNGLEEGGKIIEGIIEKLSERATTKWEQHERKLDDLNIPGTREDIVTLEKAYDWGDKFQTLEEKLENVLGDHSKLKKIRGDMDAVGNLNVPVAEGKDYTTLIILLWAINFPTTLLVAMACVFLYNKTAQDQNQAHAYPQIGERHRRLEAEDMGVRRAYSNQRNGPPTRNLSLITFSDSTTDEARSFFQALGKNFPPTHMIRDPDEVMRVPTSRCYLVIIGYDVGNSIVEDMDDTHGSKKRATIGRLEETGGDVMIMYIDTDTTTGVLPEGDLFHQGLERPRRHPVLSPFVRRNRFLSIHRGKLTNYQADHLKNWIKKQ